MLGGNVGGSCQVSWKPGEGIDCKKVGLSLPALGVPLAARFHKFAFKLQVGHRAVGLPATNDTEGQLSHADEDQHEVQDVPYLWTTFQDAL